MKIEFFSTIDGVADVYPIVPASEFKPNWMKRARDDYKEKIKNAEGRLDHIYQCPGIFDLAKTGYVLRMWHDVIIETASDGNFRWTVPTSDLIDLAEGKDIIAKQTTGVETLMPVKPWSSSALLKINTPWHIIAPKGIKLLMIPYPYPESFELESSIGILDPGLSTEVNVQAFWNVPQGKATIKAGTPIAQFIPITEKELELEVRNATEKDLKWIKKSTYIINHSFTLKRNVLKDIYYKYFGEK